MSFDHTAPPTPSLPSRDVGAMVALTALWQGLGLPAEALAHVHLPGAGPVLPSSFAVATAAQASLAAAALASAELWHDRHGQRQQVSVERVEAALECTGHFTREGRVPPMWDKLSGLYPCGAAIGQPGWIRLHANFSHHRDGALQLLGCAPGPDTERDALTQALRGWGAQAFEAAAAEAGLVVAAARSHAQWLGHPQAVSVAAQPVVQLACIGDAVPMVWADGRADDPPLHGLRVLDLTRILAGPVCGRTLAGYGAEVMLINGPHLPNIEALADTSRGKLSALVDLRLPVGVQQVQALAREAHVFLQAYRPGALAARGLAPEALAALRPGIVVASLSAYGPQGPWAARRGFDSLVQTATGFNQDEAEASGSVEPRAMPVQILDYAAGYLLALGVQAALWRQARQGGSWHVQVSLAGVGQWLRQLGRVPDGLATVRPALDPWLRPQASGFGVLQCLPHAARFSRTPARWRRPAMPPGSHPPSWPVR